RSYDHRWMLTHSTGISKKGWAFTFSGSRRWADEGYVPGTYYNGWSYFAAIDKRLGQKHLLSLVAFGAPTENGRQGAATTEIMDLAGSHYYNPYWGFQDGKKRNSSVAKSHQPVFILTHDYRINNNTSLITAVGYSFGDRAVSGLDWYNAPDPRPDYYRYLPSYYADDPVQQAAITQLLKTNEDARQIDWDNLYNINRGNTSVVYNANGIEGNNVTGQRSYYILGDRVVNTTRVNFNSTINSRLSNHIDLTAGASFQYQKNNYFEKVNDLLGGDFWVDVNQFAQRDFPLNQNAYQNDLNHPNQIVKVGDRYGYDYDITVNRVAEWAQLFFQYNKVDFFAAAEGSHTEFWRTGNTQNGLFPDNSFGKSKTNAFNNYSVKGGVTYKFNGRNYVFVNAAYLTRAPYFDNAYVSARTRDFLQDSLVSEKIETAEAGYIMNAPKIKIRLSGYYTHMRDAYNVLTFYNDAYQSFVNYALSNIDRLYFGGEFGLEAKVLPSVTINAAAAVGRYYYDSRQQAIVTLDNDASVLSTQTVYSENFRIPATPQEAYSFGVTYRSPKFWFISITGNYFGQMWLDFNPIRRTVSATDGIDPKSQTWSDIIDQQKLDDQYTVDVFAGYSYKMPKRYNISGKPVYLVFYAGANNILDNQDIITGGYEQLRFDFAKRDINTFPPKYYYGYGLNYFFSAAIRF
ncbi:MAG: TonB-dependent receptor, partial [Ginsengibacter sp.]